MSVEYRLWDGQWVNIVNSPAVLDAEDRGTAVAVAVRLCEEAMASNIVENRFPPKRNTAEAQGARPDER